MIVKICGITRVADARACLSAGADWIGLNLVGGPRRIAFEEAAEIAAGLDEPRRVVPLVGVEHAEPIATWAGVWRGIGAEYVQLYGDVDEETVGAVRAAGLSPIVVRHVRDEASLIALEEDGALDASLTSYVLLDAHAPDALGGTGRKADWPLIGAWRERGAVGGRMRPGLILAGGLRPENVAEAVRLVRPDGVDVSSGVESSPGVKDIEAVRALVETARRADAS